MLEKQDTSPLSSWYMILFAVSVGALVADLYYAQPLLADIAASLHTNIEHTGYLITAVQFGYALGVLFIVPLGDHKDKRSMVTVMLSICVLSLLAAAASQTFMALAIASIISGIASSATMVIIPYVASHSPENVRGQKVGQIMTGLLLGILLARTISGYVAHLLNWRWMYVIASIMIMILGIGLRTTMVPDKGGPASLRYRELILSLGKLLHNEPELRWRSWYALLGLGSFSVLWTGLTFLLSQPPYSYGTETIGLFGLIGAAGALSANVAGRLGDLGLAGKMTGIFVLLLILSWLGLTEGEIMIVPLIAGIFVIDVAVQGLQVTHQSVLYRISTQATSRITSVFITSGFIGMSLGSALASEGYARSGWAGVCRTGQGIVVLFLVSWLVQTARNHMNQSGKTSQER